MLLLHHALFAPAMFKEGAGVLFLVETENTVPGPKTPPKMALPVGLAPTLFPQTTGCFSVQLRERNGLPRRSSEPEARTPSFAQTLWRASFAPIRLTSAQSEGWWEVLVTLQFVTSDFVLRHLIYSQAIGSLPEDW
jgi:hypothetical protein